MKRLWSIFGGIMVLAASVANAADLQKGIEADQRGDYAMAVAELRPLAEQGDVTAEFKLGKLYQLGTVSARTMRKP